MHDETGTRQEKQVSKILKEDFDSASSLIDLAILERINLIEKRKKSNLDYIVSFDINKWKKDKFKKPLYDYKMPKKNVNFVMDNNRSNQISGLKRHSKDLLDKDFYI